MVDLFADDDDDLFLPGVSHQASLPKSAIPSTSGNRWQSAADFAEPGAPGPPISSSRTELAIPSSSGSTSGNQWQSAAELAVPGLTALMVSQRARSFNQAESIVRASAIYHMRRESGGRVLASVRGSAAGTVYSVEMTGWNAESLAVQCTCPDFVQRGGLCKHGAALLLVLVPGSGYIAPADADNVAVPLALHAPTRVKEEGVEDYPKEPPPLPPPADPPPPLDPDLSEVKLEAPKSELPEMEAPKMEIEVNDSSLTTSSLPRRRKLPASFFQTPVLAPSANEDPNVYGGDGESEPRMPKRSRKAVDSSKETAARAPSAYQLYLRATKSFGNAGGCVKWKDLSPEERRPYEEMAAEARMKVLAEKDALEIASNGENQIDSRQKLLASCGLEEHALPRQPFDISSSNPPITTGNGASASSSSRATLGRQLPASVENTSKHSVFQGNTLHSNNDTGPVSWACPRCTFENSSLLPACEMCGTKRGRIDAQPAQKPVASVSPPRKTVPVLVTARETAHVAGVTNKKEAKETLSGLSLSTRFNHLMDSDSGDEAMSVPDALRVAAALDTRPVSSLQSPLPQPPRGQDSMTSMRPPVREELSQPFSGAGGRAQVSTRFPHDDHRAREDLSASSMRPPVLDEVPLHAQSSPQAQASTRFASADVSASRSTPGIPPASLQHGVSPSRFQAPSPSRSEPLQPREVANTGPSLHVATTPPSQLLDHGRPVVSFFDRLKDLV